MALSILALAGCSGAIPRTGPTKGEIFDSAVQKAGNTYVVEASQPVARATFYSPAMGFSSGFRNAGEIQPDIIHSGDTLGLTIWENVDEGLLGVGGAPVPLERVQVDSSGMIFVPYAGRVLAAGKSPEELRGLLTRKLETQTPDPQIVVTRSAGDGATVSVSGKVSAQGVYPIQRPTLRLSSMLARAGGVTIEPEIAQVTVLRGSQSGKVWFDSLYANPSNDIALRAGDRILVEADERFYTAVGATGRQSRVRFETQELSAIEAIAQVGGLSGIAADPTGIFVLRQEPPEVARRVLGLSNITSPQQVAYIFNLTSADGLFVARNFNIRDEDTIYVTEAPVTQFNKAVAAIFGSLSTVAAVQTVSAR
ncbi:polysaccharide biosynthesis/export family protein [Qingshengfaniella alkalisoli]|uniref:Polysaccharide export protein n=1 Tax=Qingshengfaniella alkalisoli TaxID=2599296 RepID=A0A5B8ITL9_9RHOB|nr:polysaccharide biosynthesis/export family protein [Qingshengfaniella alkalisoli]QDY68803.1 polysaccharide export protein [Qingshengfaniella alkalisoli]